MGASMIGVFDSGHGGLTVLRTLAAAMPGQRFLYLGDHGNAPYGCRPPEEILALTVAGVERLFEQGCRLVVLACNTAAAVALRRIQQDWLPCRHPGHRVLGVLVPMVEAVTRVPWLTREPPPDHRPEPRTVGIFATQGTVSSNAFPFEIGLRAPAVRVVQQACPDLAGAIERGAPPEEVAPMVGGYVRSLLDRLDGAPLDTVVLGCTHYPLVADAFAACLPEGTEVLSQPDLVAASLGRYLDRHRHFAGPAGEGEGEVPISFLTTGDAELVGMLGSRFFGRPIRFSPLLPEPAIRCFDAPFASIPPAPGPRPMPIVP
jgi:glutamate racemase